MAKKAAEKTNQAIGNEQGDIANLVGQIEDILGSSSPLSKEPNEIAQQYDMNQTENTKVSDGLKEMYIPKGFKVVSPETDKTIEYADKNNPQIDEGIVIADDVGNEFVWVPCTEDEYKKHNYDNDANDEEDNIKDIAGDWNTMKYRAYSDWTEDDEETNRTNLGTYKGFYIARYEAGVPSNASFYVDKDTILIKDYNLDKNTNVTNLKPVSKKGMQAWNCISQKTAKNVSSNMYDGNAYGVISKLVDGIAWDRTVDWISNKYTDIAKNSTNNGNYANNSSITITNTLFAEHLMKIKNENNLGWSFAKKYKYGEFKSGLKENWTGDLSNYRSTMEGEPGITYKYCVEMATGVAEDTKLKNIYDMAGNMCEWTTEYGYHDSERKETKFAVRRGATPYESGDDYSIASRYGGGNDSFIPGAFEGFRVILYIK